MLQLNALLQPLRQTPIFLAALDKLARGNRLPDQNLLRSARPIVIAALWQALQRPVVVITGSAERAYNITQQLPVWISDAPVVRFPEPKALFYERIAWSEETIRTRLEALGLLFNWQSDSPPPLVVASAQALMPKTLPKHLFAAGSRRLRAGQVYEPDKLIRLLLELGYEGASMVTQPGQFSRRGGVLDLFPVTESFPIRLDYFDTEIESLHRFDPATQRSLEAIPSVSFTPTREAIPKHVGRVIAALNTWASQKPNGDGLAIQADLNALQAGIALPHLEFYLPWLYETHASLLDYLPDSTLLVLEDWGQVSDEIAEVEYQALQRREEQLAQAALPPEMPTPYYTWDDLQEHLVSLNPLHLGRNAHSTETVDELLGDLFLPDSRFGGQLRNVLDYLHGLRQRSEVVITVSRQAEHLTSLWNEAHSPLPLLEALPSDGDFPLTTFIKGELAEGWQLQTPTGPLHLLTDSEIFGWKRPEPRRRQRPRTSTPEALFADLEVGDYVVHIEHGIGRFAGLVKREIKGEERELLQLQYAENDMLFVPIHQADRLTRYVNTDDSPPKLNRLGTQEWSKIRQKATQAAEALAEELLKLYAAREVAVGHAFGPDTPWQHELEASFPYIETDDQLKALQEVKADMEAPHPMDRLICGDVGYGKTEIALRAAFKAVMDGKQVAVLVPTTILANQHYYTFSERLKPFPVKVELLSRFRTEEEKATVLTGLASGEVDILIGTHGLLAGGVRFKELGLVVIDEEQRFGMTQKERLKLLRQEVDVLTLTATPIPRTLYMGITGLRDISVINTPPDERLPVLTHVGLFDQALVRKAILRELDRGGQVFFVHNRVQSIDNVAEKLRALVPEANIGVGHSQMNDDLLESVMAAFSEGHLDVLVSTAIIESGLDIPNANTIIIDRADWFGLASLYQLRGRVGRSANQGYAYFFHASTGRLTEEAKSRLEIIGEETQLGAGFSIAMRDLEIRGAGEMLGKRQSGHIVAVGFHLYTQLLAQAVQRLKRQDKAASSANNSLIPTGLTIDLPLPTYIPQTFIPDSALRIQLYRRLADLHDLTLIQEMRGEIIDRFGEIPEAVEGLLYQLQVKLLATLAHASAIVHDSDKIGIRLPYLAKLDRAELQVYLGETTRVSREAVWLNRGDEAQGWQAHLLAVLQKLGSAIHLVQDDPPQGLGL
jgi:transcription-repair coupling factor (superfamily II helicase)